MQATWGAIGVVVSVVALGCSGKAIQSDSAASAGAAPFGGTGSVGQGAESAGSAGGDGAAVSGASSLGVSGSRSGESTGGGSTSGGSTSGGSASGGGSPELAAGAPNSVSTGVCSPGAYPPFQCVASCAVRNPVSSSPVCDGERWLCPEGLQSLLDCAPDSCAVLLQSCCDPVWGNLISPCGADGRVAPCAAGQTPNVTTCLPAGLDSCYPLANLPCTVEGQNCDDGGRMPCLCQATSAGLIWACATLPG
jgi:hypothetical protein